MRIPTILTAALAWLAAAGLQPAAAQTVDEILSKGTINIGVLVDLPPYALLNDKQEPDGYDRDVAMLLGKYMGVKVNLVQLNAANRIPFLVTGKVDLLVATFGITPERAKQVLFSNPYSAIENVVYCRKDAKVSGINDLKGLRVAVPRGTVQDVIFTQSLGREVTIVRFDDTPSGLQAALTGQTDCVAETGITSDAFFKQNNATNIERKFTLLQQPNGVTMRKDQWNLRQWVNTFLYFVKNNGELTVLHEKWFGKPLPTLPYL